MSGRKERYQPPRLTKGKERGLTRAEYIQLYLGTMMGAFERDWVCILITTNLRGRAVLVDAGQPRQNDGERRGKGLTECCKRCRSTCRWIPLRGR